MAEITEQERRKLNETLARAMGWKHHPDREWFACKWDSPDGKSLGSPPDFTRDASARDELLRWLAPRKESWVRFCYRLHDVLGIQYGDISWESARKLLTADPLLIAMAAAEAIGGSNE